MPKAGGVRLRSCWVGAGGSGLVGTSRGLAEPVALTCVLQNLVMFMSDFVDWVIPDIPKDISQQVRKEKALLVELFMREEQDKQQLLESWRDKAHGPGPDPNHSHGPSDPGGTP